MQTPDVDLDEGIIWIVSRREHRTKTAAAEQPLPIAPLLAPYFEEWLRHRMSVPPNFKIDDLECPWVFPTTRRLGHGPWCEGYPGTKPRDRMKAVAAQVGVIGFGPLVLRHSMATHLMTSWGGSPGLVKRVLRHTSEQMQQYYVHDDLPGLKEAFKNVEYDPVDRQHKARWSKWLHLARGLSVEDVAHVLDLDPSEVLSLTALPAKYRTATEAEQWRRMRAEGMTVKAIAWIRRRTPRYRLASPDAWSGCGKSARHAAGSKSRRPAAPQKSADPWSAWLDRQTARRSATRPNGSHRRYCSDRRRSQSSCVGSSRSARPNWFAHATAPRKSASVPTRPPPPPARNGAGY